MAVARPLLRLDFVFGLFDSGGLERASALSVCLGTVHAREVYSQTLIIVNGLASDARSANWVTLIKVPRRTPIHLACVYCN
jgi:hypothetical protein